MTCCRFPGFIFKFSYKANTKADIHIRICSYIYIKHTHNNCIYIYIYIWANVCMHIPYIYIYIYMIFSPIKFHVDDEPVSRRVKRERKKRKWWEKKNDREKREREREREWSEDILFYTADADRLLQWNRMKKCGKKKGREDKWMLKQDRLIDW